MLNKIKEVLKSEEQFDRDFALALDGAKTQQLYILLVAIAKVVSTVLFAVNLKNLLVYGLKSLIP